MGGMAAWLAHQLGQPLATITNYLRGSVHRLQAGQVNLQELRGALEAAATEADRAGDILRSICDFVARRPTRATLFDLNESIRRVLRLDEGELRAREVRVVLQLAEALPAVSADRVQVEQILLNVIRNAAEAMAETGSRSRELTIRTAVQGDAVEVAIRDGGCGLAPEVIGRLFEPFHTTKADGLGLGLAISQALAETYGGRLWAEANPDVGATFYFALNTRIPPFNNLKARQAVNYATDRNALVKIYGGPKLNTPTCQVLPPQFPGYSPYCPYTKNPGSGKWTAPDLTKAKQLVTQSGTKGATVKVNTDTTPADKSLGEYFITLLNSLGYNAKPQFLSNSIQYPFIQNSKNKVEFAFSDWFQDYPAASDFLNILLGCGSFHPNSDSSPNIAAFCNKGIQAKMDQASTTGVTDPTAANHIWAQVDHEVTDQAPWVAMFNPKQLNLVSPRLKGYLWSPQWYLLLDQASVK